MDDDVFGTSVWSTSTYTPPATDIPEPSSASSIPAETTEDTLSLPPQAFSSSSDDQFDDFDEFGTPAETIVGDDQEDDFGDFGDFGDADEVVGGSADFPPEDASFGEEVRIYDIPPILGFVKPLELDPVPERGELVRQVNEIMGPICGEYDMDIMTEEPLREREGLDQILVTSESREVYNTLLPSATPPMQPVNWTRSRTRRQHLISLGIPINLDEVLPRTMQKLPAMQITTRSHSVPPGPRNGVSSSRPGSVSNSRAGSPRPQTEAHSSQLRLGSKPELDETIINGLLNLTPESMNLSPLSTLEGHKANIKMQTASTSTLLTYLLQTRDALQQDSETYNQLIAELVGEAQKIKTGSKLRAQTKRGSGST